MSKKTKKPIKPRKSEKPEKQNNQKNQTVKKNWLNRLNFKKTDRFGFGFISLKPKKPNRIQTEKKNQSKPEKTEQNWAKPKKPSHTDLNRFLS